MLVYIGYTTLSLELRRQELQDPECEFCPLWVKFMLRRVAVAGAFLRVEPVYVVTTETRRCGRVRELLVALWYLRQDRGALRARGAVWCDARTYHTRRTREEVPIEAPRYWNEGCRNALEACLQRIPAHVTGAEDALPADVVATVEALAVEFACVKEHLDNIWLT